MSTEVIGIEKPVVIDRKQNLREHRLYWVGRRMQDVVLSALALVVLSPVMLATAIITFLKNRGSISYGQNKRKQE